MQSSMFEAAPLPNSMAQQSRPQDHILHMLMESQVDPFDAQEAKQAIEAVEQDGIVFLDEIDKICKARDYR